MNVCLRISLYLDVFWASSCLQSIASSRGGSEWTFPRQMACLGGGSIDSGQLDIFGSADSLHPANP